MITMRGRHWHALTFTIGCTSNDKVSAYIWQAVSNNIYYSAFCYSFRRAFATYCVRCTAAFKTTLCSYKESFTEKESELTA